MLSLHKLLQIKVTSHAINPWEYYNIVTKMIRILEEQVGYVQESSSNENILLLKKDYGKCRAYTSYCRLKLYVLPHILEEDNTTK